MMALDDGETFYRALFQLIPQGFCVVQMVFDGDDHPLDYIFLETNAAFENQTGLHDPKGKSMRSMRPDHEEFWFEIYGKIALSGQAHRFRHMAAALHRYYEVYAFPIGPAENRQVAVIFEDIRERIEAEQRLRDSEAKFRFLDGLGRAIAGVSDADAILAITTRMLGRHLGLSNSAYADMDDDEDGFTIRGDWAAPGSPSIVGRYRLGDFGRMAVAELKAGRPLIINDNLAELAPDEAKTFQDIGIAATICMPLIKEGRLVALMAIHDRRPHPWSENELGLISEVTQRSWAHVERVAIEAALRDLNATLEQRVEERTMQLAKTEEALRQSQKMEAVGQLTGGLAHDFNNLLTAISGSLEMIQARVSRAQYDGLERFFSTAEGSIQRAAALTHRLLAFARRQTLDPKPTDVNRLVWDMEELIRRTVGPAIFFEVDAENDLSTILIDPNQLENALLNLCINARDAMPDGGHLTIRIRMIRLEDEDARALDLSADAHISICVSDTGSGMSEEVSAKAFDPFYTTKQLGEGTGLGLSMVYGFVRQSGGQVRIDTEVGRGTTICMYLPQHDGAPVDPARKGAALASEKIGRGEVILLVDDEENIRMLLAEAMADAGFTVLQAPDAQTALTHLAEAGRIDLMITDVGLPRGMNGRELADRAREQAPHLKIMFITGYAENAIFDDNHARGMSVVSKPFHIDALMTRIGEAFG